MQQNPLGPRSESSVWWRAFNKEACVSVKASGANPRTGEIWSLCLQTENSTTQVNVSKRKTQHSPFPAAARRPPERAPDAARRGSLTVLAFFSLAHWARTSAARGLSFPAGGCWVCFPVVIFRCPSARRKPARPLQVHRAGGIPRLQWSGSYQTAILINQLWSS